MLALQAWHQVVRMSLFSAAITKCLRLGTLSRKGVCFTLSAGGAGARLCTLVRAPPPPPPLGCITTRGQHPSGGGGYGTHHTAREGGGTRLALLSLTRSKRPAFVSWMVSAPNDLLYFYWGSLLKATLLLTTTILGTKPPAQGLEHGSYFSRCLLR